MAQSPINQVRTPNDGYVFYDPDGDGDDEALPVADPNLEFPSDTENQQFAHGHKALAQTGHDIIQTIHFQVASLGPLYVNGSLTVDSDVPITLNGHVYVTGSIHFTKELVLSGNGTIIAEGDINFEKGSTLDSSDPDARVIFMSLNGDFYLKKEQGVYNGLFYAPNGSIALKKGQQIEGSLIAGEGFSTDKDLSVTYVAFNQDSILPGYVGITPQIQTWDIGTGTDISINPSTLPSGKVNITYPDQTLVAFGGTAPYSWSISSGSLPNGLSLGSGGIISGTPDTYGTFDFTITATDGTGKSGSQVFSIVISSLDITTASPLPDGQMGNAYNQTVHAIGGTFGYTWSIISGTLPAGITLNSSSGVLSGTPTTAGDCIFTVKVTDSAIPVNATSSKIFSISIQSGLLSITTTTLAGGFVGVSYDQTLAAMGGATPYNWSLASGSLPAGLSLSSDGVISGVPNAIGTSAFTIQVTDSANNTATSSLSISINNPAPTLSSILPTSGSRGSTLNVVFTGTNFISGVSLVNVGTTKITVNYFTVNSSNQITVNITLSSSGSAKGTYNFSVTNSGPGGGTSGTQQFTITN